MITELYNNDGHDRGYYDHEVGAGLLTDWMDHDLLESVRDDFSVIGTPRWYWVDTSHERMFQGSDPTMWSTAVRELLSQMQGREFISLLHDLTDIDGLRAVVGDGGYRLYTPGCFQHPRIVAQPDEHGWHRFYVEVLLNRHWDKDDGGELTLFDGKKLLWKVAPEFNNTAIVRTSGTTYRGVLTTHHKRLSVVMNYYSNKPPEDYAKLHKTILMGS